MSTFLFLLLVLACPLLMWWMMRGGHSHGGQAHSQGPASVDDLLRRREDLDEEIAALTRRY